MLFLTEKHTHTHSHTRTHTGFIHGHKGDKPIQEFFDTLSLTEKETLNGIAVAGQCQFSCLADQLWGRECTKEWRADIFLRKLAVYVIATNDVS